MDALFISHCATSAVGALNFKKSWNHKGTSLYQKVGGMIEEVNFNLFPEVTNRKFCFKLFDNFQLTTAKRLLQAAHKWLTVVASLVSRQSSWYQTQFAHYFPIDVVPQFLQKLRPLFANSPTKSKESDSVVVLALEHYIIGDTINWN